MNYLGLPSAESKPQKANSTKNSNLQSGSANGVYVDLGKALLEASKAGDAEKVQECIKNGAPFITDWLGTSALHIACKGNFFDTCATLLRSGISKDAKTKVDRTPLHFAVNEGNFEICQLLLQHECSVDPLDMLRMTPLHWAVEKGFDNIAELLIENGANPHIQSKFLKSPYSIAKEKSNDFIVNLIESLPTTPNTPSLSSAFDSSVFIKTPTSKNAPNGGLQGMIIKDEPSAFNDLPSKRARFHSYDGATDSKRLRATDAKNLTLQLLQEQMNMMSSTSDENSLIQHALQSGRKIMLSEAGKRLLNDSALNKFLKIPLNTTISSSPSPIMGKNTSPKATTSQRRTSDSSNDVLEIFRDGKKSNNDILNLIRSTDLQEVTITQRPSSKPSTPVSSPKTGGISLSAITVPKAKAQSVANQKTRQHLPSSSNDISVDLRTATTTSTSSTLSSLSTSAINDDFSKPDVVQRKYSELLNNYQQLKRAFEREQQKSEGLQRQLSQFQSNFETYKRQQQQKLDSILFLLQNAAAAVSGNGDSGRMMEDVL